MVTPMMKETTDERRSAFKRSCLNRRPPVIRSQERLKPKLPLLDKNLFRRTLLTPKRSGCFYRQRFSILGQRSNF